MMTNLSNIIYKAFTTLLLLIWLPFALLHEFLHFIFIAPLLITKQLTTKFYIGFGSMGFIDVKVKEGDINLITAICLFMVGIAPLLGLIPILFVLTQYAPSMSPLLQDYWIIGMITCLPSKADIIATKTILSSIENVD